MSTFKGFTSVELQAPKKSRFDLTHDKRLSTRMGKLTPCLVQECIPGDSFQGSTEVLVRLAPLLSPVYDQIQCFVHFFFVPNRLLWEDWEEFITGGRLGESVDVAPVPPYTEVKLLYDNDLAGNSTLADYMGCPDFTDLGSAVAYGGIELDVMPFAAYYKVWYDYYRDRNYIADNTLLPLASGSIDEPTTLELCALRTRDYLKDYFTSALPFTQRGDEVLMPLEGTGSVTYLASSRIRCSDGTTNSNDRYLANLAADPGDLKFTDDIYSNLGDARIENIDSVLLTASSVSINDFRAAYALQVWLERNAIGGTVEVPI